MNKDVEVKWAKLQTPLWLPFGGGNYKETLEATATGHDKGIKMYLQTNGLYVVTKGLEVFVPSANINAVVLANTK